jgi:hypothetical protein
MMLKNIAIVLAAFLVVRWWMSRRENSHPLWTDPKAGIWA